MNVLKSRKPLRRSDRGHDPEAEPGNYGGGELVVHRLVTAIINLMTVLLRKWF